MHVRECVCVRVRVHHYLTRAMTELDAVRFH